MALFGYKIGWKLIRLKYFKIKNVEKSDSGTTTNWNGYNIFEDVSWNNVVKLEEGGGGRTFKGLSVAVLGIGI